MNLDDCFCTRCRKPISEDLSRKQGVCDDCLILIQAEQAQAQQAAVAQAQAQQRQQKIATIQAQATPQPGPLGFWRLPPKTNTKPLDQCGPCPVCHSTDTVLEKSISGSSGTDEQACACCLGLGCLWPFLLLIPLIRDTRQRHEAGRCLDCGHRWAIL